MEELAEDQPESQNIAQETPAENVFIPPSIDSAKVLSGGSYTYHSAIPKEISANLSTECVLGVDEAGRGPVLGMTAHLMKTHVANSRQDLWCMLCTICHYRCIARYWPRHTISTTPRYSPQQSDQS
jgi:ribonuclease H2 subunit A